MFFKSFLPLVNTANICLYAFLIEIFHLTQSLIFWSFINLVAIWYITLWLVSYIYCALISWECSLIRNNFQVFQRVWAGWYHVKAPVSQYHTYSCPLGLFWKEIDWWKMDGSLSYQNTQVVLIKLNFNYWVSRKIMSFDRYSLDYILCDSHLAQTIII